MYIFILYIYIYKYIHIHIHVYFICILMISTVLSRVFRTPFWFPKVQHWRCQGRGTSVHLRNSSQCPCRVRVQSSCLLESQHIYIYLAYRFCLHVGFLPRFSMLNCFFRHNMCFRPWHLFANCRHFQFMPSCVKAAQILQYTCTRLDPNAWPFAKVVYIAAFRAKFSWRSTIFMNTLHS